MSSLERGKISGVVKESANLNLAMVDGLYAAAYVATRLRPIDVEGILPKQGPAILMANHISNLDPFIMGFLTWRDAKRHVRIVAKHTLFDTSSKESEATVERIGRESFPDNAPTLVRQAVTFLTHSMDAIPVNRGTRINRKFVEEVYKTLENGGMMGIFLNDLRENNLDLLMASPGAAMIAKRFPTTNVIPVGFSGTEEKNVIFTQNPCKVKVGQPFTYDEVRQSVPDLDNAGMTEVICKRIADLIEPKYKYHWTREHNLLTNKE